ncbi:MAG: hypothetical protein ACLFTK_11095 [Anaerolineales bacterium]
MMLTRSAERLAWVTLLAAFAVFIISVLSIGVGLRWFVLESTVALETQLRVGQGTMGIRQDTGNGEEAVRMNRALAERETITTDEVAQGYIQFVDTSHNNRVVGNALILPGGQIRLASSSRPRFNLGDNQYTLRLNEHEGRLELEIPPNLPRDIDVVVEGSLGRIYLSESGLYHVWSFPDSMTLLPRGGGQAQLEPFQAEARQLAVPSGQTAIINADTATVTIRQTTDELVQNPLFLQATGPGLPDEWGCYSFSENADAPRGGQIHATLEGRRALHIHRAGVNPGYGETGCRQFLGDANGLDVSEYRTLRIRATVNVLWHSLSICGSLASECPLMLELTYLNEIGIQQRWIHGFWSYQHNNLDIPLTCNSCLIPHDRIPPGNWHTYESANLFELPDGFKPSRLQQIRFYAAGHEYEVYVGEIALLAER